MIFVDSSFWIAQRLPCDRRHPAAERLQGARLSGRLVTSSQVAAETWTFLRRRAGPAVAWRWHERLVSAQNIAVEHVDRELEDEAWAWLRAHDERPYSFVDATSFALMRKLRIREALAFDGDFAAAGFVELRP